MPDISRENLTELYLISVYFLDHDYMNVRVGGTCTQNFKTYEILLRISSVVLTILIALRHIWINFFTGSFLFAHRMLEIQFISRT